MTIPTISSFTDQIKQEQLLLTKTLVAHPVFAKLLDQLKIDHLIFNKVKVTPEEQAPDILISGESVFLSLPLTDAYFLIYKEDGEHAGYEFEWSGTLNKSSVNILIEAGLFSKNLLENITKLGDINFDETDFIFTSHDQAFAFETQLGGPQFNFSAGGIGFSEVGFFYECSLNPEHLKLFQLLAKIKIGSNSIEAELTLPAGNFNDADCWVLKTNETFMLDKGVEDLISFFSNSAGLDPELIKGIRTIIPKEIIDITAFGLTELEIHFVPSSASLQLINLSIQSYKEFQLFEGFSITDVGLSAFLNFGKKVTAMRLSLFGGFAFSEYAEACMEVALPFDKDENMIVTLEGSVDLASILDLEKFKFIHLEELNLPKEWLTIGGIRLHHFKLVLQPPNLKPLSLSFAFGLNAQSELIPGIKIKNPYLEFNLTF